MAFDVGKAARLELDWWQARALAGRRRGAASMLHPPAPKPWRSATLAAALTGQGLVGDRLQLRRGHLLRAAVSGR